MGLPCLTTRFFQKLHDWELEEAMTALDFLHCRSLSQLSPSLESLNGLIEHQLDQVYDRHAVYCMEQDRVVRYKYL